MQIQRQIQMQIKIQIRMQKHKDDMFWVCLFERYLSSAIRSFARLDRQSLKKEKKGKDNDKPKP